MKRNIVIALVIALVLAVGGGTYAYANRPVGVKTGERVVCVYGHTVKDTVREVRVAATRAKGLGVKSSVVVCPIHAQTEKLYDEAQKALAKGDTKTALQKLESVRRLDPGFKKTSVQIREIQAGRTPTPDTSQRPTTPPAVVPPGTTPKPGTETTAPPTGPVASLLRFVPDVLTGYTASPVESDEISLSRRYLPASSDRVTSLVVAAEQFKDSAFARQAIDSDIRSYYGTGADTVSVSGRSAFFGTRDDFAVLAWNEEGVRVVVEMQAASGEAVGLKDELTAVAAQIVK